MEPPRAQLSSPEKWGGRGLGAGKLCKVAAAGSCCWDYRAQPKMWAKPISCYPKPEEGGGGAAFPEFPTKSCLLHDGEGSNTSSRDRRQLDFPEEVSRFLPLTEGHILPGQALGSWHSGTRSGKGRALCKRYHPPFVQDF